MRRTCSGRRSPRSTSPPRSRSTPARRTAGVRPIQASTTSRRPRRPGPACSRCTERRSPSRRVKLAGTPERPGGQSRFDAVNLPATGVHEIVVALHDLFHLLRVLSPLAHLHEGFEARHLDLGHDSPIALGADVGQHPHLRHAVLLAQLGHLPDLVHHRTDLPWLAVHDVANQQHGSSSSAAGRHAPYLMAPEPRRTRKVSLRMDESRAKDGLDGSPDYLDAGTGMPLAAISDSIALAVSGCPSPAAWRTPLTPTPLARSSAVRPAASLAVRSAPCSTRNFTKGVNPRCAAPCNAVWSGTAVAVGT